MKKLIFIYILFNSLLFINPDPNNLFNEITRVDNNNKKLIEINNDNMSYKDLFYYFCLVSEETERLNQDKSWFEKLESTIDKDITGYFGRSDVKNWDTEKQKTFASQLLIFIHDRALKRYDINATKLSSIVDRGEYNCVSSSILYALFLKKYNLECRGVETIDHVFIKIKFRENDEIDVETTNRFGFDPGKKKDILDQFGVVTGFTYVSPKDYKNRNDIEIKKILFLVYHNLTNIYSVNKDYYKSVKLGYIIFLGRNDKKGKEDFEISFNNYIVDLISKKDFNNALDLIDSYLAKMEFNNNFFLMRFGIMIDLINNWNDYNKKEEIKDLLLSENNSFESYKNHEKFKEVYLYFVSKLISHYNSINDFEESYRLIKDYNSLFNKNGDKLFEATYTSELKFYEQQDKYEYLEERILKIKYDFPEYGQIIKKYEVIIINNKINKILTKKDYLNALDDAKKEYSIFPDDDLIKKTLLSCYVSYTIYLYESKDLNNLTIYTEEALKYFPNEKILLNNYSAFLKNFIKDSLDNNDFSKARRIYNIAKEKFPNDSYLYNIDKFLQSKNY